MQTLITNAVIAKLDNKTADVPGADPYGLIDRGYLAIENGQIAALGRMDELREGNGDCRGAEIIDAGGGLLTPALIDCHTHIIHGGHRATEFELRLKGASYEGVARAGGGIVATVTATRALNETELVAAALPRVDALLAEGVSMIEVKSGYGLDIETELRMLRAARMLARERPIRIVNSFLGAHALPAEYAGDPDGYIDKICIPALRQAHQQELVDAVDGFCETIAFNASQIERVFAVAKELCLPVKLHAEQLSRSGGCQLAARFHALSVDHVEYADADDAQALAAAGTVVVLLPGAFYTLRETQVPPVYLFRKANVAMALASDANPGSSPLTSLLLAMNMGCTLFRMTPAEALAGVTKHAAKALGLADCGKLAVGLRADIALWDVQHPAELSYRIGFNPLKRRFFGGNATR